MNSRIGYVALVSLALGACGGGGGGGGSNNPQTPPQPPAGFSLTTANSPAAVAAAWQAANSSLALADLTGASGFIASTPGGQSKPLAAGAAVPRISLILAKIPFGPEVVNCEVSGTLTISGDIADPQGQTFTAGDFIDVVADNCDDGFDEILDGTFDMDIDSFNGSLASGVYELIATLTLVDFQVTTPDDVQTSNGDATVAVSTLATPVISGSVGGNSLTLDTNSDSNTLTNYESSQVFDGGVQSTPYELSSLGTLQSSDLAGNVTFTTPVTFEGFAGEYPSVGELLISGSNSSARLVAIDNVNVRIDVDTDGNGTVDATIDTTWAEIQG